MTENMTDNDEEKEKMDSSESESSENILNYINLKKYCLICHKKSLNAKMDPTHNGVLHCDKWEK